MLAAAHFRIEGHKGIILITGPQVRAARAMLAKTQKAVAEMAGLSEPTVKRFEGQSGELTGHSSSIAALRAALEAAGIIFLDEGATTTGGPGIRLSGLGLPVAAAQNRNEGNDNQANVGERRVMQD